MKKFLLSILSPHKSPLWIVVIAYFCFLSVRNDITGDLGKIGQIVFSEQYHLQEKFQTNDFETNNIEWCDVNSFHYLRLLFLGDSRILIKKLQNFLQQILNHQSRLSSHYVILGKKCREL